MPYQVQSPIAAGIDALSGFLSGQTQKKQYQAQQAQQAQNQAQAEADTQARLSLARETAASTAAYRQAQLADTQATAKRETRQFNIEHGLDPDTGASGALNPLPKELTSVSPGNKGKGPKPGSVDALRAKYAHDSAVAQFYASGQGGNVNDQRVKDLVARWNAQAAQASHDLSAAQVQAAEADRAAKAQAAAVALHGTPTWGDLHLPHGGRGRTPSAQEQYFIEHGYSPPTYAEAHPNAKTKPPSVPQQRSADADDAQNHINQGGDYDKITRHYAAKWGIPLARALEELSEP